MTPAQEVLLERLKYSGKAAVSTLEPRDCKALHEYVVELQQERDELAAKVRRLREALEWSIEESDPSPCPYCGVGGKCLPHLVLAELEGEAMTSDEALMRGRG